MTLSEEFSPLRPSSFFDLSFDCQFLKEGSPFKELQENKYSVPYTHALLHEEPFCKVQMGWNGNGLYFLFSISQPFQDLFYPDFSRGDAVELFIDTRNLKSPYNTKFCHHFLFLPKEIQGVQALEITKFRTDDKHDPCSPDELQLETIFHREGYQLKIFIPSHCLVGYNPDECDRIGCNYRIHRAGGDPQNFCASPLEYAIEQQPFLWSTVRLVDANKAIRKTKTPRR